VDTVFGHTVYIGLSAIILNIAVTVILTLVLKAARVPGGADETLPREYKADPSRSPRRCSRRCSRRRRRGGNARDFPVD
jgi:predicted anti-sigma-YlaC factor YlaD